MNYECKIKDIELSETVHSDVLVYFTCTHPGYRGTYEYPGEGPEFEIQDIEVESVSGETWEKDGDELGSWDAMVREAAEKAVDRLDLYDEQFEAYLNYDPEPYWC